MRVQTTNSHVRVATPFNVNRHNGFVLSQIDTTAPPKGNLDTHGHTYGVSPVFENSSVSLANIHRTPNGLSFEPIADDNQTVNDKPNSGYLANDDLSSASSDNHEKANFNSTKSSHRRRRSEELSQATNYSLAESYEDTTENSDESEDLNPASKHNDGSRSSIDLGNNSNGDQDDGFPAFGSLTLETTNGQVQTHGNRGMRPSRELGLPTLTAPQIGTNGNTEGLPAPSHPIGDAAEPIPAPTLRHSKVSWEKPVGTGGAAGSGFGLGVAIVLACTVKGAAVGAFSGFGLFSAITIPSGAVVGMALGLWYAMRKKDSNEQRDSSQQQPQQWFGNRPLQTPPPISTTQDTTQTDENANAQTRSMKVLSGSNELSNEAVAELKVEFGLDWNTPLHIDSMKADQQFKKYIEDDINDNIPICDAENDTNDTFLRDLGRMFFKMTDGQDVLEFSETFVDKSKKPWMNGRSIKESESDSDNEQQADQFNGIEDLTGTTSAEDAFVQDNRPKLFKSLSTPITPSNYVAKETQALDTANSNSFLESRDNDITPRLTPLADSDFELGDKQVSSSSLVDQVAQPTRKKPSMLRAASLSKYSDKRGLTPQQRTMHNKGINTLERCFRSVKELNIVTSFMNQALFAGVVLAYRDPNTNPLAMKCGIDLGKDVDLSSSLKEERMRIDAQFAQIENNHNRLIRDIEILTIALLANQPVSDAENSTASTEQHFTIDHPDFLDVEKRTNSLTKEIAKIPEPKSNEDEINDLLEEWASAGVPGQKDASIDDKISELKERVGKLERDVRGIQELHVRRNEIDNELLALKPSYHVVATDTPGVFHFTAKIYSPMKRLTFVKPRKTLSLDTNPENSNYSFEIAGTIDANSSPGKYVTLDDGYPIISLQSTPVPDKPARLNI